MRQWLLVTLFCTVAACGSSDSTQDSAPARPPVTAFDGAQVIEASAKVAHGERLTFVLGCRGCHGKQLKGKLWDDDPKEYGIMWASNLTQATPRMSDAQLKTLLTQGVHPGRKELWVMPSELFQHLSAPDIDGLVAYLRTLKPDGGLSPDPRPGPRALRQIESGEAKPARTLVRELRNVGPADLGVSFALGRYIRRTTCAECHGPKLEGHQAEEGKTPDLLVAGAYSRGEFDELITQGVPTGGRKLHPLMVGVAKGRFSHLTPHEREALYAYLKARAEQPQ